MSSEARQNISSFVDDLKRRIKELSDTRSADDPELKRHREVLNVLKQMSSASGEGAGNVRRMATEMRNAAQVLREGLGGVISGAGGGGALSGVAGLGMGLLGGVGIATLVGSAALITGQAMKMAYEFERVSTRAAQNLSVGSGNFKANLDAVRRGSYAGEPYGIAAPEMANAIAAYGVTSGASAIRAGRSARGIARYARGYGLDPTQLGSMIGTFSATTNEDFDTTANSLFGAAEESGPMGRRLAEFIGTATNVLATLQFQDTSRNFGAEDAASLVRNVARLGGVFGSAQGVQAFVGASGGLMGGTGSDMRRMAFAMRAGVTNPVDLILERPTVSNQRAMVQEALREGGSYRSAGFAATLASMLGPQQARIIYDALGRANGNLDALYNMHSAGNAPIDRRVADFQGTIVGQAERFWAKSIDTMVADGDKAIRDLAGAAESAAQALGDLRNVVSGSGAGGAAGASANASYSRLKLAAGALGYSPATAGLAGVFSGALDLIHGGLSAWRGYNNAQDIGETQAIMAGAGNSHFGYSQALVRAARHEGIPVGLYAALVAQESGGNPNAVSSAGAIGLAQFMPGTAAGMGINPRDPMQNLAGGARYLAGLLKRYGGNVDRALMAYNWGSGNVDEWIKTGHGLITKDNPTGAMPEETREYASDIEGRWTTGERNVGTYTPKSATITTAHGGKIHIKYEEPQHIKANAGPRVSMRRNGANR